MEYAEYVYIGAWPLSTYICHSCIFNTWNHMWETDLNSKARPNPINTLTSCLTFVYSTLQSLALRKMECDTEEKDSVGSGSVESLSTYHDAHHYGNLWCMVTFHVWCEISEIVFLLYMLLFCANTLFCYSPFALLQVMYISSTSCHSCACIVFNLWNSNCILWKYMCIVLHV